ncbi:MAG: hypothetical protein DRO67_01575 [Candidatus Asgardarchaeum californiense]|nr:MAG: hypothetical protein DRO67_01575 [Candidatus Asgardarchaeum californiense]
MKKIIGFLKLIRPINCLMMALAVFIGEIIVAGLNLPLDKSFFAMMTAFFLTGAAMVLNDIVDYNVDLINEPQRPLPSGVVKIPEAKYYYILLSILGVASAFFVNILAFMIAILYWFLSALYDLKLKKTGLLGNIVVSASVAIPFIYGGLAISMAINVLLLFFFTVAFLANTGREITKGIVDIEGDKVKDYKTVAIRYGPKNAALLATLFYLTAVILSPFPYIIGIANIPYLIVVSVADILFVYLTIRLLKDPTRMTARFVKNRVLIAMLLALISFLIIPFF